MPQPQGDLRPAVFFDRDDTLIHCTDVTPDGDLGDPALVRLLPGALECCHTLKAAGFALAVASNQGGVARGHYGLDQVGAVNDRVNELLEGLIDAFRFCPYHPKGTVCEFAREHPWRKPAPGMLLDAAEKLRLDLGRSWMVGDRERDIEAGAAAACRTILLFPSLTTPGWSMGADPTRFAPPITRADHIAPDLATVAAIILAPSMSDPIRSTVVLRALDGAPLRDGAVRAIVIATAHAIAERNGVQLIALDVADDRVRVTLDVHRLAAIGFAAELRRLTTNWHRARRGEQSHLWGEPRTEPEEDDPADWWKRG